MKIKTIRIVDGLIVLFCGALLLCVVKQVGFYISNPPKLTILENRLDFGVIPPGVPTTKFVTIKNSGGQNLVIQRVHTGCGCTEIKVRKSVLAAGQQDVIEVVLTGESQPVNRNLDIYVFSNDKKHPVQHVAVKYSTISGNHFEPSQLDFGIIHRDKLPASRSLKMIESKSDMTETAVSNLEVLTSAEFIDGAATLGNHFSRNILVTLKDNAPIGEFYEHLEVTEVDTELRYRVNIVGSVRGEVYAVPKVLDYGEINRNTSIKNDSIVLHSRNNDPHVSILSVNISEGIKPFVFADVDSEDKSKLNVKLSTQNYDGAWATTEMSGSLVISYIDREEQVFSINIPVRFRMTVGRVLGE